MSKQYFDALPDGSHVDHYRILRVLGAGGFGITYLAMDERLHCHVALKEYLPNEAAIRQQDGSTVIARSTEHQENFQYGLSRFLDEARALARFNEPNLIRVRTFLEANGTAYMVMDYEEGETLSAYLDRCGTLDEATLKGIIIPILDGLRAVHAADFLHRDIKPGNIYLRNNGPPVLIDFGAARQALGEHSRSMTGIVTAGYAPFEQYSTRGKQGPWTDLYAIGATMYRCISGHAPVESAERMAAFSEGEADPLVPASELKRGQYSEDLLSAIDWMLKPAAKDRPQRVEEVLGMLLGRAGVPPVSREPSASTINTSSPSSSTSCATTASALNNPATSEPPRTKSPALLAVLGLLVIGIAGAGVWGYIHLNATPAQDVTASQIHPEEMAKTAENPSSVPAAPTPPSAATAAPTTAKPAEVTSLTTTVPTALLPEMITISDAFKIGKYEVTQGQWKAVMGSNPSYFSSCGDCPVEQVSWDDVQTFLTKLNQMTGRHYRLPTEKEWERACGSGKEYCGGNNLDALAWYDSNSGDKTHPVGQKQANANGVYDMSGNVWEWTSGCWEDDCSRRVYRGGSWLGPADTLSAALRYGNTTVYRTYYLGFRLAQDL